MQEVAKKKLTKADIVSVVHQQNKMIGDATQVMRKTVRETSKFFEDYERHIKKLKTHAVDAKKQSKKIEEYIIQVHTEIPGLMEVIKDSEQKISKYSETTEKLDAELKQQIRLNRENELKFKEQVASLTAELEKQKQKTQDVEQKLQKTKQRLKESDHKFQEVEKKGKQANQLSKEADNRFTNTMLNYEKQIKEYEEKQKELEIDLDNQSTYTAAVGATLAKMLWKTSKSEEVINTYIETNTLNDFLNLAHKTIASFYETYLQWMPSIATYEVNYILSIFGIFTNIVAQQVGRDYVLSHCTGVSFIHEILKYLGVMNANDIVMKRLILMVLYNLSLAEKGVDIIYESPDGIDNILKCLNQSHSIEIQSIAVSLIQSLINEIQSKHNKEAIMQKLSLVEENILKLMESNDASLKCLCGSLIEKLRSFKDE